MKSRGRRQKGRRGEREVAAMWRAAGWSKAVPTPGSGGLRPHGAGDLSPWPGDIWGIEPWLCEVKYDEHVYAPSWGWVGESFIRATLTDLRKLYSRHAGIIGRADPVPALFARSNLRPWRVFVPDWAVVEAWGLSDGFVDGDGWVELEADQFFDEVATTWGVAA